MMVALAVLVVLVLGWMIMMRVLSPGKVRPFLDENGDIPEGSIAEVARVAIGGIDQGMILRGKDVNNPVILFLHGGPGSPEYMMTQNHPLKLDEIATVCWWEQRGAGMSYHDGIAQESMTLEQMIADTVEVAQHLCKRFGKEKVYLMGHSWGTFLGTHTAARHPELFHAYIGIGQVSDQFTSERLAYDYMLAQARKLGDRKLEKKLLKHTLDSPADVNPFYLQGARTQGMNKLGIGIVHQNVSMFQEAVLPLLTCPAYTPKQKAAYLKGMTYSQKHLWDTVINANLAEQVSHLSIPVYIIHGQYDYQVSYQLSRQYFEVLQAPSKAFYTFEQSAHSPLFEEPEYFVKIIGEHVLAS